MSEPSSCPELVNVYVFVFFISFCVWLCVRVCLSLASMSIDENRLTAKIARNSSNWTVWLKSRWESCLSCICIKYAFIDMCGRWSYICKRRFCLDCMFWIPSFQLYWKLNAIKRLTIANAHWTFLFDWYLSFYVCQINPMQCRNMRWNIRNLNFPEKGHTICWWAK